MMFYIGASIRLRSYCDMVYPFERYAATVSLDGDDIEVASLRFGCVKVTQPGLVLLRALTPLRALFAAPCFFFWCLVCWCVGVLACWRVGVLVC